jgi:hypothetical protein
MYPIKQTRKVKTRLGYKIRNICIGKDGKDICYYADGYYYINKNNEVSKRRYEISHNQIEDLL